jgi:hypothetical protein
VDVKRAREGGGVEALKRRPAPGARPRLSEQQRARVPELLAQGAEAHGFRGELWTCERVAIVIRKGSFWAQLPSGSCESFAQGFEAKLAQTQAEGFPAQRGGHRDNWKEKKWPSLKKGALLRRAEP